MAQPGINITQGTLKDELQSGAKSMKDDPTGFQQGSPVMKTDHETVN